MVTASRTTTPEGLVVQLSGTVEESVNLDQIIGYVDESVIVNVRDIARINSVGVKVWMRYFQSLNARGVKVVFRECSQAIVEQLNMISNFHCGAKIESILLPYYCKSCQKELVGIVQVQHLLDHHLEVPEVKCSSPDCKVQFDDDPDEYFSFLDTE